MKQTGRSATSLDQSTIERPKDMLWIDPPPRGKILRHSLCARHFAEWEAWLDYKQVEPIRLIEIGVSARDVAMRQRIRYERWRDTITSQQQLIRDSCRRRGCGSYH